jgi:type IX secretion system PorP/SprF family membrane protein
MRNSLKQILSIVFFIFLFGLSYAQDPHFSQYFTSPLTLNPANTGNFTGPSRLSSNFRNQWQGIGKPYITGTASFDTEMFRDREYKNDKFAVGVTALYDRTSGGLLTSNYLMGSLAYHFQLDYEDKNRLSVGFQGGFASKRLDYAKISFADQFTSNGFDLNLPSNQTFGLGTLSYGDINAGLMYNYNDKESSFYVGASAYHLTRPKESFLNDNLNRIPIRYTLHSGGSFNVGLDGSIYGSGLFMSQGNISQAVIGLAYGKKLQSAMDDIRVFAGAWYRNKDAVIPYLGYIYNNFQFGLTYDINISQLSSSISRYRSFEVSMVYIFLDKSEYRRFVPWY